MNSLILGAPEITANLYWIAYICIGKVAWFAVYICGNLWNAQYIGEPNGYTFLFIYLAEKGRKTKTYCRNITLFVIHDHSYESFKQAKKIPFSRCYVTSVDRFHIFLTTLKKHVADRHLNDHLTHLYKSKKGLKKTQYTYGAIDSLHVTHNLFLFNTK